MDPKHSHGPDRVDYKETGGDLTEAHAALKREHPEPTAEVTPVPLWLTAVCGVAICWAGVYLGLFHGGFKGDVFNERQSSPALLFPSASKAGPGTGPVITEEPLAVQGKAVFNNICASCHMPTGVGQPGVIPPLAGSEYVVGSEKRLVSIVLKGIAGPITVKGAHFSSAMQAWEGTLNDKKAAAVLSYVRSSWGNTAPEISIAKVAGARKQLAEHAAQMSEPEVLQIPEDATLPEAGGGASPAPSSSPAPGGVPAPSAVPASVPSPAAGAPAPPPAPAGNTPPVAGPAADPAQIAAGKAVYMGICIACHQPTGMGLPPVFPPLVKSPYVNGSPERFIAMILKGNIGPMTIDGKPFNNVMPPQEALEDQKIADVATYVRNSFENKADAITKEQVEAARKKFTERKTQWTQPELDAWQN